MADEKGPKAPAPVVKQLPYMGKPTMSDKVIRAATRSMPATDGSKVTPRRILPDEGPDYNFKHGGPVSTKRKKK